MTDGTSKVNLISDIKRLSESWNKGLLFGINGDDGDGCEEHDDDKSPKLEMPKERDRMYFKSPLFVENIQKKVDKIKTALNAKSILSHEE